MAAHGFMHGRQAALRDWPNLPARVSRRANQAIRQAFASRTASKPCARSGPWARGTSSATPSSVSIATSGPPTRTYTLATLAMYARRGRQCGSQVARRDHTEFRNNPGNNVSPRGVRFYAQLPFDATPEDTRTTHLVHSIRRMCNSHHPHV